MAHECHRSMSAIISYSKALAHRVAPKFKMAHIRNSEWQEDKELRDDLACYVRQNLQKSEILDFFED